MAKSKTTAVNKISDFDNQYDFWHSELTASKKFLRSWHEDAQEIVDRYNDDRTSAISTKRKVESANFFPTNVDILQSALMSSVPYPTVARRDKDPDDQVGRVASLILKRALCYELETDHYISSLYKNINQDYLITGLGVAWSRYDVIKKDVMLSDGAEEQAEVQADMQTDPIIVDEQSPLDYVHWRDFFYNKARTWDEVRWVARRVFMNRAALIARFGADIGNTISETINKDADLNRTTDTDDVPSIKQAEVFEIWDKNSKKLYWFCFDYEGILDTKDDDLQFPGFFPTSEPLFANTTTTKLIPRPDYHRLRNYYAKLDVITMRQTILLEALSVRGVYNGKAAEIKNLLNTPGENKLIAVDNWAMFADKGGVSGQIDWFPLDQVTNTYAALNDAFDRLKALIYELTGIPDIMKGIGQMYASAQQEQIKGRYASMRLTVKQQALANYASGMMERKAHLMCKFYEPERLLERAGTLSAADQPYIPQAIALLKSTSLSHFKIEVSVDSLSQPDTQATQLARTQTLSSVSQFLGTAVPAVEKNPEMAPLMLKMLNWTVAGDPDAEEIEGEIQDGLNKIAAAATQKANTPPPPPPPSPEQIKAQIDTQRLQMEDAHAKGKAQMDMEKFQAEQQANAQKHQVEAQQAAQKLSFDQQKHADEMDIKRRQLAIDEQEVQTNKVKTLIDARTAYQQINGGAPDASTGLPPIGSGQGDAWDQIIGQHMNAMGADLTNTHLATKEEVAGLQSTVQQLMQVVISLKQEITQMINTPMPEQNIQVVRTADGLVGKITSTQPMNPAVMPPPESIQ